MMITVTRTTTTTTLVVVSPFFFFLFLLLYYSLGEWNPKKNWARKNKQTGCKVNSIVQTFHLLAKAASRQGAETKAESYWFENRTRESARLGHMRSHRSGGLAAVRIEVVFSRTSVEFAFSFDILMKSSIFTSRIYHLTYRMLAIATMKHLWILSLPY